MADMNEVTSYLKVLDVSPNVIEKFTREKIDSTAVTMMTDSELKELGLAKGDRLKLMVFCKGLNSNSKNDDDERMEKINKIKELLQKGKRKQPADQVPKDKKKAKTTIRIEVGWKHWNQKTKAYCLKKKSTGGGTRVLNVERNLTSDECVEMFKEMFYPKGQSPAGHACTMDFALANFQGNEITVLSNGEPFTPGGYKEETGFTSPRLYLTSRPKSLFSDPSDEEDDEDDECLLRSAFGGHTPPVPSPIVIYDDLNDGLIGTSEERNKLKSVVDEEFQKSLKADKAKAKEAQTKKEKEAEQKQKEGQKLENAERLRSTRSRRVPEEPKADESKVEVIVMHCIGQILRRSFKPTEKVSAVYDWVGSTNLEPLHFSLNKWPCEILYPDQPISVASSDEAGRLFMTAQDKSVPLSPDEPDILWFDSTAPKNCDETEVGISDFDFEDLIASNDVAIDPLPAEAPQQLMEGDEDTLRYLDSIEEKRSRGFFELSAPSRVISVNRGNILHDLMDIYKDEDITNYTITGTFKNESACGDGVLRDIYSEFWDSFTSQFCEGSTQFCLRVEPSFTDEDYVAIGRIITHQYLLTGTFPVNICEAQILKMISKGDAEVDEECLLRSYKGLLTEKEQIVIDQGLQNASSFPKDDLLEILSEHRVTKIPTPENLQSILIAIAKHELIAKPYLAIALVKKGMGQFWETVGKEEVQSIYEKCIPTTNNIMSYVSFQISNKAEEVVSRWLTRYLVNQPTVKLSRFVQFCTGSCALSPGKQIRTTFETMSEATMRPKVKTCFRSLILPANINSFAGLTSLLDKCLQDISMWGLADF